ncbi:MAG: hypothetical protein ABI898_11230 [Sphingomonadales bacterium]
MRKTVLAAGAMLALAGVPVQAACWTPQQVSAAKVRDFDTMLMVSALRCRFESRQLVNDYNTMVMRHRAGLSEMNRTLGARFKAIHGEREGLNQLDRYVTQVANHYGAGTSEQLTCASLVSIAEAAIAEPQTAAALIALADRAGVVPHTPEGVCEAPVIMANSAATYRQAGFVQTASRGRK